METQAAVSFNKIFQMFSIVTQVIRSTDLTPRMRRITLGGSELEALVDKCLPADAIKLYLPEAGQSAVHPKFLTLPGKRKPYNVRAYTIRHFNPQTLELDIDILLHGNSPGSVWARTVQSGDQIGFIGPRHDYHKIPSNTTWQFLAGDESALPAIASILESLPTGAQAHAFMEVHDQADEIPIHSQADVALTWLHRGDAPAQENPLLQAAVTKFSPPSGQAYAWVAGHSGAVKKIRQHLSHTWRLDKEQMFTMGYWR